MPRLPRDLSDSGTYHIVTRGVNKDIIFNEQSDYLKFEELLDKYIETIEFELFAYCLMSNHVHLLIREGNESIANTMRRIFGSYATWYNKKYGRVGPLFQDRFKSETINDDTYFLTVVRYIFRNPVKAKIVDKIENYRWSNYESYFGKNRSEEAKYVLSMISDNESEAQVQFVEFVNRDNDDICIGCEDKRTYTDAEAKRLIEITGGIEDAEELEYIDEYEVIMILREMKYKYGLTIRQIERVTGISRGKIQRA